MRGIIERHPLTGFFVLAYGFSWAWSGFVLGVLGQGLGLAASLAPFLGPALAAFLVARLSQGSAGVRTLLRRFLHWRVSPTWYLLALLIVPVSVLLVALAGPVELAGFHPPTVAFGLSFLGTVVFILVLGGPLAEEPGWRGFALPLLQRRFGPVRGSLLLGLLWGSWHVPLYLLVPGYNGAPAGLPGKVGAFGVFLLGCTAATLLFTWIFNSTEGSLIPVILLHATNNVTGGLLRQLFPAFDPTDLPLFRLIALGVVVLVILVGTRGTLGYERLRRVELLRG